MKKQSLLLSLIFTLLIPGSSFGQLIFNMPKNELKIAKWVDDNFKKNKLPPFSFVYDGKHSKDFIKSWKFSSKKLDEVEKGVINNTYTWVDTKSGIEVVCEVKAYTEYKAIEWVLKFTNTSNSNSATLEQVKAIDVDFQYPDTGDITLHYSNGSDASRADFSPKKKVLTSGETFDISPVRGRSSDLAFPFFNIESSSNQGVIFAIGWTGTWYSQFKKDGDKNVSLSSGMKTLETYLLANESIRTPSVCILFWNGEDRMVGHNSFRRFILNHQTRKINGKPATYPISNSFNFGDPYPCNEYTCLTTDYALALINRYKRFDLVQEAFWLDAGWYKEADDYANGRQWHNTVGNWEADEDRFPDGLKPISDAVHEAGAKFMVWFEPERVSKDSHWGVNLQKWMLESKKAGNNYLYNLGNKEALDWLCKYIGDFMEKNGIDYYRQDFNMPIDNFWEENDEPGRIGISEIRHIEGLYAFWDYLLERFPEAIIDNCSSGGRRIDFETTKRSAPMWRTDYEYGEPIGYQTHTYGLNFYLPLSGIGSEWTDKFSARSCLGTSIVLPWKITDKRASFVEMQDRINEFKELRPYFYEDYYPLTRHDDMTTDDIWMAYQLYRPSDDSGVVIAFRRDKNTQEQITVQLSGVNPLHTYRITNKDTEDTITKTGKELKQGLTLQLKDPRSSLILMYEVE